MTMLTTPQITDKFLPDDLYKEAMELLRHAPWAYGAKSNAETDPHGHLSWKPVHDKRENLGNLEKYLNGPWSKIWSHVKAKLPDHNTAFSPGYVPVRVYANAYSYGMDGYFHTDSHRAGDITAIIYICDSWNPDWGGETCCFDEKNTYWAILPAPNRLLLLPSDMKHAARAVSRKFTGIRSVLVFKARPKRTAPFEWASQWLIDRGALNFPHSKGSLHDHLMRTYQLLENKKLGEHVCAGGALHSIYGTNIYKQQLLQPNKANRDGVREKFGKQAESYAYAFSRMDRPKVLEMMTDVPLDEDMGAAVIQLCLIECANLADQDSLDKWPKLAKLWSKTHEG